MHTFEILPTVGVSPIRFGMTRREVLALIGAPDGDGDEDREWYLVDLAIDFDDSGSVAFIELAESENFRALPIGKCLLELDADSAIAHMSKNLLPSTPTFPNLDTLTFFQNFSLAFGVPLSPTKIKTPTTRPDEHSRRLALAQMDTLHKTVDNHPMQPSGEIGRFEVEDQPSTDRNRSGIEDAE